MIKVLSEDQEIFLKKLTALAAMLDRAELHADFLELERMGIIDNTPLTAYYVTIIDCRKFQIFLELRRRIQQNRDPIAFGSSQGENLFAYFNHLAKFLETVEIAETLNKLPNPKHK